MNMGNKLVSHGITERTSDGVSYYVWNFVLHTMLPMRQNILGSVRSPVRAFLRELSSEASQQ